MHCPVASAIMLYPRLVGTDLSQQANSNNDMSTVENYVFQIVGNCCTTCNRDGGGLAPTVVAIVLQSLYGLSQWLILRGIALVLSIWTPTSGV